LKCFVSRNCEIRIIVQLPAVLTVCPLLMPNKLVALSFITVLTSILVRVNCLVFVHWNVFMYNVQSSDIVEQCDRNMRCLCNMCHYNSVLVVSCCVIRDASKLPW